MLQKVKDALTDLRQAHVGDSMLLPWHPRIVIRARNIMRRTDPTVTLVVMCDTTQGFDCSRVWKVTYIEFERRQSKKLIA